PFRSVPYEIGPGVTSALGAAAATQIPLTDRRASSAVVFITAHQAVEAETTDWRKFVSSGATLVVYMPGQDYSGVAKKITDAGLGSDTPCLLISRATTRRQRTHRTTIAALGRAPQLNTPTLMIVGEVVRFADRSEEHTSELQ